MNTASGDVEVGRVEGAVRAQLVSGDCITVRDAGESSGSARSPVTSGSRRCRPGKVELHSVSGDIAVGVRRGTDVWLDVRSMSGDMSSSLTPTDGPAAEGASLSSSASSP